MNKEIVNEYFKQTYEERIIEELPFCELKSRIKYNQGYISQTEYNKYINNLKFLITNFGLTTQETEIYWNYVLNNSQELNKVLSQLHILSDEEYKHYKEEKIALQEAQKTPPKLTAPDLAGGFVTCILLCCLFFIFNYFWVYWIMIWACYYLWRKEQIIKFNPQHFRKENENAKKNL